MAHLGTEPPMPLLPGPSESRRPDHLRIVLVYAIFAGLWILLSDRLVELLARGPTQVMLLSILKGWVFVGVTSLLLYRLMQRKGEPAAGSTAPRRWLVQALLPILAIALLAGVGIRQVLQHQDQREFTRLQAIADLKAKQANEWLQERLGDVRFLAAQRASAEAGGGLLERLEEMRKGKGFLACRILDAEGAQVAVTPPGPAEVPPELKAAALQASRTDRACAVGPYLDAAGACRLDVLAPLASHPGQVAAFSTDPSTELFPLLQTWPIPTTTGEVMVFRVQGDEVRFLTGSGAQPDRPFNRARSIHEADLVVAKFARGLAPPGTYQEGRDYRDERVLAVTAALPDLDAYLIAKIDLAEVRAGARGSVSILVLAGLLASLLTLLVQHLFRQRRSLAEAARDRAHQARSGRAIEAQNRFLERIAAGEPLPALLGALTSLVAELAPGISAGILLLDGEAGLLRLGARNGGPEGYWQALDGVPVAEGTGPCGRAALLRTPVQVQDPAQDPRFSPAWRALARTCGIRSVWSTPILSGGGTVLGTLTLHWTEDGAAPTNVAGLLAMGTHLAAITLESHGRKQALEASSARFRQLFEAAPTPLALVGPLGILRAVNGQFTRMTGYRLEDVPTLDTWFQRAYPDPAALERARAIWAARTDGRDVSAGREALITCADGHERTVQITATAIGDELLVSLVDFSDRVRDERERQALHEEVRQAQKMESIGRLAGGVAHDFNNMLGVIVANAEMGLLQEPEGTVSTRFEDIRTAALRSAELTRQLLAFARKQAVSPRAMDLDEAIPGVLKMLARLIGENIALDYAPGADLWPVRMDPTQLDQILANLAVNARDAIQGVGRISIRTENVVIAEPDPVRHPRRRAGEFVLLEVGDTGCGMAPDVLQHVFEPFYTTKGMGRGTGLGLATVYGIVRQNGGFLEVASVLGQGSTFSLFFPRHHGSPEAREAAAAGPAPRGHERILVVEDEPMNLEITTTLLASLGYRVLPTPSPGEALRLLETDPDGLDLLLTDVVMPEMDGSELARRAQVLRPGLKCLFMSGYQADLITREGVLAGNVRLLAKPFTLEQLAYDLRAVLD